MTLSDLSGIRYCLGVHGWPGCEIPLQIEGFPLPSWSDIIPLRAPETFDGHTVQLPYKPILVDSTPLYPALQFGEQLDKGSYGRIVKTLRALYTVHNSQYYRVGDFAEIVCKINDIEIEQDEADSPKAEEYYAEEIQAVLNEAVLHALAGHVMKLRGFPTVIPTLYEVFAVSGRKTVQVPSDIYEVVIGMEFVEGQTLHRYLADTFHVTTKSKEIARNDRLLMDILIQLCVYLEILQHDLRFNHRDLKTNNVLRRTQSAGWNRCFQHPALHRPWIAYHDLVLIDFGFSCVGCMEDTSSAVQAGAWFRPEQQCLKGGRDIALFLHCMQVYFPLQKRISSGLWEVLRKATCVQGVEGEPSLLEYGVNEEGGIEWTTAPTGYFLFSDGIYRLLRKRETDVSGCAPATLLAALDTLRQEKIDLTEGQEASCL